MASLTGKKIWENEHLGKFLEGVGLSNKSLKIAAGIGLIALAAIAAVLYVGLGLFEAENVKRGSIAYYLGLPAPIRSIPLVDECQVPVYRWRGRDGESSPFISVTYSSRSSLQNISDFYKSALTQLSCSPETSPPASSTERNLVQFNCRGPYVLSVNVWAGNEASCRSVTLDIIENY